MIHRFLTGSYAEAEDFGVCRFTYDSERGFRCEQGFQNLVNPSYILPHPLLPVLYTVEETSPEGAVCAWKMEDDCLIPLNTLASGGDCPCHLCLSKDEQYLYAANYMNGTLAVFSLDKSGDIENRTDLIQLTGQGPNRARQEGSHAHCSLEAKGLLYVCDLGADRIAVFENENGRLREKPGIEMPAGCGPRHLAVHPAHQDLLYCVTELESSVYVIQIEENKYTMLQRLSALPEGFQGENTAAAIHFSPDGRTLMTSNRGHDSIAAFSVQADGLLKGPVLSPTIAIPRDFIIFGQTVIVGSQRDDLIMAYTLNEDTLALEETPFSIMTKSPVCFAKIRSGG